MKYKVQNAVHMNIKK